MSPVDLIKARKFKDWKKRAGIKKKLRQIEKKPREREETTVDKQETESETMGERERARQTDRVIVGVETKRERYKLRVVYLSVLCRWAAQSLYLQRSQTDPHTQTHTESRLQRSD